VQLAKINLCMYVQYQTPFFTAPLSWPIGPILLLSLQKNVFPLPLIVYVSSTITIPVPSWPLLDEICYFLILIPIHPFLPHTWHHVGTYSNNFFLTCSYLLVPLDSQMQWYKLCFCFPWEWYKTSILIQMYPVQCHMLLLSIGQGLLLMYLLAGSAQVWGYCWQM